MKSVFNILSVFLFVTLAVSSGFAQNKVGNGGDVILCKTNGKTTATLLDFYEAATETQSTEKEAQKIAEVQLQKWQTFAPKLTSQYQKRLKTISQEIDFKSNIELVDIQDSHHLHKPLSEDCEIKQIAVRKAQVLAGEKRFLIREDLWKQLSPTDQAGLLTHEIIYEHLAKMGQTDSVKVRKMNAALYQNPALNKDQFWKMVHDLEVSIYP